MVPIGLRLAAIDTDHRPDDAEVTLTDESTHLGARPVALDLSIPIELVVLSGRDRSVHCRPLGSEWRVNFGVRQLWKALPGEIATVIANRRRDLNDGPYLSGTITSTRIAVDELDLVPLGLQEAGNWDPAEHYWRQEGDPIEEWARPIIDHGPRPQFEMEQVRPSDDPDDQDEPFFDSMREAVGLKERGEFDAAVATLMRRCRRDLRCLDAHSNLGSLVYEHWPEQAIRNYEIGMRIGELTLGEGFEGVLPWGLIDNRPFLRCAHGYGLCLWRLGRFEEAAEVFERMLWLNPTDNQRARFLIDDVRAERAWEECTPQEGREGRDDGHGRHETQQQRWRRAAGRILTVLRNTPPWTWPRAASGTLVGVLRDAGAGELDRLRAADLAAKQVFLSDQIVDTLLQIVANSEETDALRGRAAFVLGPVLENAEVEGFDELYAPICEAKYLRVMAFLRQHYEDPEVPALVRKRILEASVRGIPIDVQDWHQDAVREAFASDDEDWRRTAVYAMRWVPDFEEQIVEALESANPHIQCQAVHAVASWEIEEAWPRIFALVNSGSSDTLLMLALVGAVATISPHAPHEVLGHLIDSGDEEVAESARGALGIIDSLMREALAGDDDEEGLPIH